MSFLNMIIFFLVFFCIYGLANYYIFTRGWQVFPRGSFLRIPYLVIFLAVVFSYMAGRMLGRYLVCVPSQLLTWIGSFWFGSMLYLFLALVFLDLLRLSNHFLHWFPVWVTANYERTKHGAALVVIVATAVILIFGYFNALHPIVRTLTVDVSKTAGTSESLSVALVTDIHLGTIIKNSRLAAMVDTINSLNPDVVLLAGDIIDEDIRPVIEDNMGETLRNIRSRYGTYAVTGNHEYYAGVEESERYLSEHGVTMLDDTAITIDERFVLVGREDRTMTQWSGRPRKPLEQILADVRKDVPIILMDHQPLGLDQAIKNAIDLQVSGHTHHGQLWPLSIITNLIYEISWGYKKSGGTNFYVSCGYGTWGPPIRLGNQPEVVHIVLRLSPDSQYANADRLR